MDEQTFKRKCIEKELRGRVSSVVEWFALGIETARSLERCMCQPH